MFLIQTTQTIFLCTPDVVHLFTCLSDECHFIGSQSVNSMQFDSPSACQSRYSKDIFHLLGKAAPSWAAFRFVEFMASEFMRWRPLFYIGCKMLLLLLYEWRKYCNSCWHVKTFWKIHLFVFSLKVWWEDWYYFNAWRRSQEMVGLQAYIMAAGGKS